MRNPVRRNRDFGKKKGGRVKNGRAIEKRNRSGYFHNIYSLLSDSDDTWQFYKDNPSRKYFHPCDAEEYYSVLRQLPAGYTKYVKAIILPRMSKRDERYGIEAKRRYDCIIMNPFPKDMKMFWGPKPSQMVIRHYDPWCRNWKTQRNKWYLQWNLQEIKNYYLYHVFLHELGHINQPNFHSLRRREEFAEDFALEWARYLRKLS